MNSTKVQKSNIVIKSAHDIEPARLKEFYAIMYPDGANAFIWKWLNRTSFYNNEIPIVAVYEDRIIGHAGMIPFKIVFDSNDYKASWFIDFYILPEFQRQGVGLFLTEKWMEFSDLYVTFCNEKSMGVFKKHDWIESFDTYYHRLFLLPFNSPKLSNLIPHFSRTIFNILSRPILNLIYQKYASSIDSLRIDDLKSCSLDRFISYSSKRNNTVMAVRDFDYLSWRILNSPDKDKYRIIHMDGVNEVSFIIKMCDKYHQRIDLLWISNPFLFADVRRLISTLAVWALSKNYTYIRYLTTINELSFYLSKSLKSWVQHLRFAFYSNDTAFLNEIVKRGNWHWQLVDSDFEEFYTQQTF